MVFHLGYIDPGTGSVVLQAVIGGGLGLVYVGRKFIQNRWNSLKALVSGQRTPVKSTKEAPNKL